jgi:cyanophycinase
MQNPIMKLKLFSHFLVFLGFGILFSSFQPEKKTGRLFIIGGGDISASVVDKMIHESGIDKGGYGIILPMSSEEPDSAVFYTKADFVERGCTNINGLIFKKGQAWTTAMIDSIRNARMIFISGGDQSRFMDIIAGTPVKKAIHEAFDKGALVCGTSAGAALMSKKMVTGNELKHPSNDGVFNSMEAKNIEIIEGLGMMENVIIDQHFIKRKRLNRMVCASMENPDCVCIGIDESTAILVNGNDATVYGKSQVVVLRHPTAVTKVENGLLGATNMQLDVYLTGESFRIKK